MDPNSNINTNVGKLDSDKSGVRQEDIHSQQQQNLLIIKESFDKKARQFIKKTEDHSLQGLNPGGYYQAIWCRDASFILRSWLHSGNIDGVLQQISTIWLHQIESGKEEIVYGRGSPEMDYKPTKAKQEDRKKFEGALPTTIYPAGYSEVYGLDPDLDSTALMISTTSWILTKLLKNKENLDYGKSANNTVWAPNNHSTSISRYSILKSFTNLLKVIDFVIPCMVKAVDYLQGRDIDNDGILEQNHNEDWMDTSLRAGKVVYSQACYMLALNNLSFLLSEIGQDSESKRMMQSFNKTLDAVEDKLWLEKAGSYIDILQSYHIGGPHRILTQDVVLYLVAISENTNSDALGIHQNNDNNAGIAKKQNRISEHPLIRKTNIIGDNDEIQQQHQQQSLRKTDTMQKHYPQHNVDMLMQRANRTLDSIKERVWLDNWPTNIETLLKESGPLHLKPYMYHNRTFWPWITGIEMTARSRFDRFNECDILLSKLASEDSVHIRTFYEWVNPINGKGGGAYPFRTGVCTVRNAIEHIVEGLEKKYR